jgi:ribokinase
MKPADSRAVIVVGSINEDVMLRIGRRIHPGETVTARRVERRPGGKGANQAAAAAAAGAEVAMLGAVGDDPAGIRMVQDLRRRGVNTESVRTVNGVSTGTAYITVTPDGENTIVLDQGANEFVDAAAVEAAWPALPPASVLLSLLEIPLAGVTAAVRLAAQKGIRPVVTLTPAQPVPGELLHGLDPLLVNEHEAAYVLHTGELGGQVLDAARELLRLGPKSAVVTAGAAGAAVADGTTARLLPAVPVAEVVDTTGAGDAFAGALAAALGRGADLDAAVATGLRAGAEAVQRAGARLAPGDEEPARIGRAPRAGAPPGGPDRRTAPDISEMSGERLAARSLPPGSVNRAAGIPGRTGARFLPNPVEAGLQVCRIRSSCLVRASIPSSPASHAVYRLCGGLA